jgi:hypothetical protein
MIEWCARRGIAAALLAVATALAVPMTPSGQEPSKERRPRFTLRARPEAGISPATVVFSAELIGGADDYEDYYCPFIEWDWADETKSESTSDCEPYETGKSTIRRRFVMEHIFRYPGSYRVYVRLKRGDRIVTAANVILRVLPGRVDDLP